MIQVTHFWNKVVDDDTAPFGRRVTNEYVVKEQYRINNTLADLKKRWKGHPRMTILPDKIIEDMGRYYGIHSYSEIIDI